MMRIGLLAEKIGMTRFYDKEMVNHSVTILKVQNCKIISKKTTSKLKIIEKPLPKDDPHKRKPDINLAKEFLNWQPSVGIDEGLNNTINYFKDINSQ